MILIETKISVRLSMIYPDYIVRYGNDKMGGLFIPLQSLFIYNAVVLRCKALKVDIPTEFESSDQWGLVQLTHKSIDNIYPQSDFETPSTLRSVRTDRVDAKVVWDEITGEMISVMSDSIDTRLETKGFPKSCLLTRPSWEPLYVKFSTISDYYRKMLTNPEFDSTGEKK